MSLHQAPYPNLALAVIYLLMPEQDCVYKDKEAA